MKNILPINLLNREQVVKDLIDVNKEIELQRARRNFNPIKDIIDHRSTWERLINTESIYESQTKENILEGFKFKLIPEGDPLNNLAIKEAGLYKFFSFLNEKGVILDTSKHKNSYCYPHELKKVERLKDLLKLPDEVHTLISKTFKEEGFEEYNYHITIIFINEDGRKFIIANAVIKKLLN